MSTELDDIDSRWDDPTAYDGSYPPDWDARRKTVYRRDDWTCTSCGRKSGPHAGRRGVPLHAHHEHPLSQGGSNQLSNLTTLCESCHNQEHDHDITESLDRRSTVDTIRTWITRFAEYLKMAVVCLIVHLGIATLLFGSSLGIGVEIGELLGTNRWLVAGGYGVLLLVLTVLRPRTLSIVFGLSGGLALGLVSIIPSATHPTTLLAVAGLFWLPAALASGWSFLKP